VREIASQRPIDWASIALAGGFCDQAHLVHEFRAFSEMSPEAFVKLEQPFPESRTNCVTSERGTQEFPFLQDNRVLIAVR